MVKKTELENKLPYGAKKVIAKRVGLTEKTVAKILRGNTGRLNNCMKVFKEAKKLIREFEQQKTY